MRFSQRSTEVRISQDSVCLEANYLEMTSDIYVIPIHPTGEEAVYVAERAVTPHSECGVTP